MKAWLLEVRRDYIPYHTITIKFGSGETVVQKCHRLYPGYDAWHFDRWLQRQDIPRDAPIFMNLYAGLVQQMINTYRRGKGLTWD